MCAAIVSIDAPAARRHSRGETRSPRFRRRLCPSKVIRYAWETPSPQSPHARWPDWVFDEIFGAPNGWSLGDYWRRCTLGLIEPHFGVTPAWHVIQTPQDELMHDRGGMARAARDQALQDGVDLSGYHHVIAYFHPAPSNAGATRGDAVFDSNPFTLGFFQHEVGHVLGFSHSFGPGGVYDDGYCVMGGSRWQDHAIPTLPGFADVALLPSVDLFRSERRLCAASLYRYVDAFRLSTSVVRVSVEGASTFSLVGARRCAVRRTGRCAAATSTGEFMVEYRPSIGDDSGVVPAVVVRSIGHRAPPRAPARAI
ncbi:MAG: hypothetical protein M3N47_08845 [Chloroflexota bacterium]|nr:hypothetical protein [Chloroflexota bacterium]